MFRNVSWVACSSTFIRQRIFFNTCATNARTAKAKLACDDDVCKVRVPFELSTFTCSPKIAVMTISFPWHSSVYKGSTHKNISKASRPQDGVWKANTTSVLEDLVDWLWTAVSLLQRNPKPSDQTSQFLAPTRTDQRFVSGFNRRSKHLSVYLLRNDEARYEEHNLYNLAFGVIAMPIVHGPIFSVITTPKFTIGRNNIYHNADVGRRHPWSH